MALNKRELSINIFMEDFMEKTIAEKHKALFDETYKIEVEVLDNGKLPIKAHKTDAGFDLFATEDFTILNGCVSKHPLNIKMKLPRGTYAQITSKSGLGSKGVLVYAGVIDESYRGIPHVVCTLLQQLDGIPSRLQIKKGQKVAQLVMHPYSSHYFMEEVETVSNDTERGSGGFGSTGKV